MKSFDRPNSRRSEILSTGSPLVIAVAIAVQSPALAQERKNYFQDAFVQVTSGLAGCPVPEKPLLTQAEVRAAGQVAGRVRGGYSPAARA
jgi:hypothetical protein